MATPGTARLEAFSDGVFAIAITLLILEIRVPESTGLSNGGLTHDLLALWPSLLAFFLSFWVILIMWVNHHELIRMARGVDYPLLFANGVVLLMVTFVPFPTAVLARHLGTDAARAASAFYCGTFAVGSLTWNALFATIVVRRRLLRPEIEAESVDRVRRAYVMGPIVYAVSVGLALWNPWAGLALCTSLWVVWTRLCYQARQPSD